MLARAYRDQGVPLKTMQVLDPIIKNNFNEVRAYVEYTRAMLETGETVKKAAATLSLCRMDGETDSAFIGLYAGLLYVDHKFVEAQKLWDDAKELDFSDEERTRRQYTPRDHVTGNKLRFSGGIVHTKPSFVIVQPDEGPTIISKMTAVNGTTLAKGIRLISNSRYSAKGPLAENLRLV